MLDKGIAAVIIPFVVQFLKKVVPTRFAPVVAFILGTIYGAVSALMQGQDLMTGIIAGIAIGGTSTGLYDLTKVTVKGK